MTSFSSLRCWMGKLTAGHGQEVPMGELPVRPDDLRALGALFAPGIAPDP
jgi:hypothetical protein